MTTARVVFAGTPAFALTVLDALVVAGFPPVAVLTQPDRPAGRGRGLFASPVKQFATAAGLPVLQPTTLRDAPLEAELRALRPELLIVAAYGLILPQAVLDLPAHGAVNVHASLLPRWRGAAPIQAAILAGDPGTGISLMQMEAGLDSGPVYAAATLAIGATETAGELHDRLAALGAGLLVEALPALLAGTLCAVPQDAGRVTYAGKLSSADAGLDWRQPAASLERRVRALNPVPGARFAIDDAAIKCWRAQSLEASNAAPGTVLASGKDGIDVACGHGTLRLLEVQRPGKRRVTAAEFARQRPLTGSILPAALP